MSAPASIHCQRDRPIAEHERLARQGDLLLASGLGGV